MARSRTWTVGALASASGLDVEEVLLALWGEEIEYPLEPSSKILPSDTRRAEDACGVSGSRERRVDYWTASLSVSRTELAEMLADNGFILSARATNVPKNALRRLRRIRDHVVGDTPTSVPPSDMAVLPAPPFEWHCSGHEGFISHLTLEEVLAIHSELERDFAEADDPIFPAGVRYLDLLYSAVDRPQATFSGEAKYTTVESAGAALLHSLVHNHPFHNGNKRTALVGLLAFLDRNNLYLTSDEDELFRWMLMVAGHKLLPDGFHYDQLADRETDEISRWIVKRTRPIQREERTVQWRVLARILREHGCEIRQSRGEKLEITRTVVRKKRVVRAPVTESLTAFYTNTGDGREVPRQQLKRIRAALELDEEHGVDSNAFYTEHRSPDYFIAEYSKLLRRLSRV